jgi:hypothetical protein
MDITFPDESPHCCGMHENLLGLVASKINKRRVPGKLNKCEDAETRRLVGEENAPYKK